MTTQDSSPPAPLSGRMMPETLSALRDLIAETDELQKAAGGSVTARALDWLLPQYAVAARKQVNATATPGEQWSLLRQIASDIVPVRRAELAAGHLALERQRLAFDEARAKSLTEKQFWKWTKRPAIRRKLWPPRKAGLSKRSLHVIERAAGLL